MTDTVAVVERDSVEVMFTRTADEQEAITRTWAEVEGKFASLKGRKFYGVFYPGTSEYHVCVERQAGDHPETLGLESGSLPEGRYARLRLQGEPPALYRQIAPAFTKLAQRPDRDPTRPQIEFYRRHDTVDLLLPVAAPAGVT